MHMIDALVSPVVGATMWTGSIGAIAYSTKKISKDVFSEKKLPIMAVSGAFVFAAQMINFTIPGTGSSGHIGGGILLASLLGEFPALLTIAAVLVIQCLLFADGGLLALGANIFNMGVLPCLIVYPFLVRPLLKKSKKNMTVVTILGCVIGLQLGAFAVVLETQASGITELPFSTFVLLMQPIHLAIGLGEGIVTASIIKYVAHARAELIDSAIEGTSMRENRPLKKVIITFAILTLFVGGVLSLFASSHPDGLEWSVQKVTGMQEVVREGGVYDTISQIQEKTAVLPDYDYKDGMGKGTSASGIVGAICTFVFAFLSGGVVLIMKKRKKSKAE